MLQQTALTVVNLATADIRRCRGRHYHYELGNFCSLILQATFPSFKRQKIDIAKTF